MTRPADQPSTVASPDLLAGLLAPCHAALGKLVEELRQGVSERQETLTELTIIASTINGIVDAERIGPSL